MNSVSLLAKYNCIDRWSGERLAFMSLCVSNKIAAICSGDMRGGVVSLLTFCICHKIEYRIINASKYLKTIT